MGMIDNIFGPKHKVAKAHTSVSREPKYVEVDWKSHEQAAREYVRVVNLNDFADVETILDVLRERNSIVILKIKPRLVEEKMELKRALKRIQRTCQAIGGDIAGIKEDIIVITPPNVAIWRSGESVIRKPIASDDDADVRVFSDDADAE
ncbi:MAG: cell division protein SepF [archaeon]